MTDSQDLWSETRRANLARAEPLARRVRPRTLDEYVGQDKVVGPGTLLRRMLESDRLTSAIFWGPPGTGKTGLAEIIGRTTGRHVEQVNAVAAGTRELREILAASVRRLEAGEPGTLLVVDEIHRFARNQQDVLLADVERGTVTLIGLTTENPSFAIRGALLSRSTVFRFEPLDQDQIARIVRRAIADERGFGGRDVRVADDAIAHWARLCDGDARRALTALEVAVLSQGASADDGPVVVDLACAQESIQAKALIHDVRGDEHYDLASALIKSMRGSDPDAAVYWLVRMLEGGEDPRFIARRVAILASEDIGNADPEAIRVAGSAWSLVERIGMPECRYALAQAVIYMAAAPKSNASARALWSATRDVREERTVAVPRQLRDASYRGAAALGHGENYQYPHDSADGYVEQDYLGVDRVYYVPTDRGEEARIARRLAALRRRPAESTPDAPVDSHE